MEPEQMSSRTLQHIPIMSGDHISDRGLNTFDLHLGLVPPWPGIHD